MPESTVSAFEQIIHVDEQGEYWLARARKTARLRQMAEFSRSHPWCYGRMPRSEWQH